jgi:hypothetical protein
MSIMNPSNPRETIRPAVHHAFLATDPESYEGEVVADGHCAKYVQACSGAPLTALWREGPKVKGAALIRGTAIATFIGGRYASHETGNHAAIYDGQTAAGIWVWEQWKGHPVSRRLIHFRGGKGSPSNDGDAFSVIYT